MACLIIPTKDCHPVLRQTFKHALAAIQDMEAELIVANDGEYGLSVTKLANKSIHAPTQY